jgi:hypothetical protein
MESPPLHPEALEIRGPSWQKNLCRSLARDPTATLELTDDTPTCYGGSSSASPFLLQVPPPLPSSCLRVSIRHRLEKNTARLTRTRTPRIIMTWNKSLAVGGSGSDDTGLARLRELGYKQELKRDLSYVPPLVSLLRFVPRSFHAACLVSSSPDRHEQGAIQLRLLLLHHLRAHGGHHALQHGAPLRRPGHHDLRLVRRRRLHHGRRALHGRDLLLLPDLRRPLLLERATLRQAMGALRVLDHRMVCASMSRNHPSSSSRSWNGWLVCRFVLFCPRKTRFQCQEKKDPFPDLCITKRTRGDYWD